MARPCAACSSEHANEINRKLRAGTVHADVSRWLTEIGAPITPHALGRHAKGHLAIIALRGRRPPSTDFLASVRDAAADGLASGELAVTLRDGIAAQKGIDARESRNADRDLMLKIAAALAGGHNRELLEPEIKVIEGEFRPLLSAGD